MVSYPVSPPWSIRTLGQSDEPSALAFLRQRPIHHVYLISKIMDEGLGPASHTIEICSGESTICITSLASNVILAARPDATIEEIDTAMAIVADRILTRVVPIRAIISDVTLVERLWKYLRHRVDAPTVVRLNQPVYALDPTDRVYPDLQQVRYATPDDLEMLVPACAAMHKEEVGIDPLDRDAAGYRQRIRELIYKMRSTLWPDHGRIAFKCELSAVTDQAVQLMGVWTAPSFRRQGYARSGLREICGHFFRQKKTVTLFVNDFNDGAIALYESLGFRQIGRNRALIW